jgi:hypothetical protein
MKHIMFASSLAALGLALVAAQGCGSSAGSEFDDGSSGSSGGKSSGNSSGFDPKDGDRDGGGGSSGGDGEECATASAEAKRTPVYMLLVVDGSGSMDGLNSSGTAYLAGERENDTLAPTRPTSPTAGLTGRKWLALRGALAAFFDDVASKNDKNLAVGMYLFSSNTPKSTSQVDVPISFVDGAHATALKNRLLPSVFPGGSTPLAASMNGQIPILDAYTPQAPVEPGGKYVLVVMTDGIPSDGTTACINAASSALAGSKKMLTFAVGVGDPTASSTNVYDEVFMGNLAEAGGTAAPGCNTNWSDTNTSGIPCHFQITPGSKSSAQIQAEFLGAIDQIRESVTSCELALDLKDGDIDPTKVNVEFTAGSGQVSQLQQDPANGWTYDDPSAPKKVILHGSACSTLKSDPSGKIRIIVGCKTVVAPAPK